MFLKLPDKLIYKIVNKLEKQEIYYLTLTSKYLNKMNFHCILTALMFKDNYNIFNIRSELLNSINFGYTLGDYLSDLYYVNNYNMYSYETPKKKYIEKKMYKFNHNQKDLFEKKELMNVKIHPIYRIPLFSYRILRIQKSSILALIY